tara:strand:+ start:2896 stop:4071 length:1176 start_codon:yes stop_codon:yes gene_type:complete
MADRTTREYSTQAPAGYVGDFLQQGIFPYAQGFLKSQFDNLGAPNTNPYTYTGPRVAQFDPREQYAMDMSDQAIGSYRPYLQNQSGLLRDASRSSALGTAAGARSLTEAEERLSTLNNTYDPSQIASYMNPYTEEVLDRSIADIREQTEKGKIGARDRAVSSGAFGGSRGRLTEEDVERTGLRSIGDISSKLRAANYENAQTQSVNEFARQQAEKAATASGYGQLGNQFAQMGNQAATTFGNLGNQYGSMANALPALQSADINRTMGMGGLGRGRQQSLMDLNYQNFTGQYNLPMQTLQNVGALTASLGPMAGGFGYAGANYDADLQLPAGGNYGAQFSPNNSDIGIPGGGIMSTPSGGGVPANPVMGSYGAQTTYPNYTGGTYGNNMPVA